MEISLTASGFYAGGCFCKDVKFLKVRKLLQKVFWSKSLPIVAEEREARELVVQGAQQVKRVLVMNIAGEIEVKIVLKIFARNGAGLNLGQVQTRGGEACQHRVKRSCAVRERETDADFICILRKNHLSADYDKPRAVAGAVLNLLRKKI